MAAIPRIDLENVDGVWIVRFRERKIYDERMVREVGDQVFAALPGDRSPIRLIVDFTGVEVISSSFLGKLILLLRRVDASNGKLRLCEMNPVVAGVFRTSNLDRLFGIDRDRRESLEKFK